MQSPTDQDLVSALRLRRWALSLLWPSFAEGGTAGWTEPPPASDAAWRLFLTAERCALPLIARLPPGGAISGIAERRLRAAAEAEGSRVLGVRGQLRRLGALAARRGWTVVVLKSGALLAQGGEAVDLVDLDVLVPPEQAADVEAALLEAGYEKVAEDSGQHLGAFVWEGTAKIEVHFTLRPLADRPGALERAVPAAADPRLRVLAPADHAWHVLNHAVQAHPERRGCVRDLALLAAAVGPLGESDLREVERRAADDAGLGPVYLRLLDQARRIGTGAAWEDAFRVEAACRVLLLRGYQRSPRRVSGVWMERPLFGFASGSGALRDGVRHALLLGDVSRHAGIAALQRVSPALGRAVWRGVRLLLLASVIPGARLHASLARRLAAEAG